MNDDAIRKRVQERLVDGRLPRQLVTTAGPIKPGQLVGDAIVIGSALTDACIVCDAGGTQTRYNTPRGSIAFHKRCYDIWKEEADKPIRRRT